MGPPGIGPTGPEANMRLPLLSYSLTETRSGIVSPGSNDHSTSREVDGASGLGVTVTFTCGSPDAIKTGTYSESISIEIDSGAETITEARPELERGSSLAEGDPMPFRSLRQGR
jgi:hypothetical protein